MRLEATERTLETLRRLVCEDDEGLRKLLRAAQTGDNRARAKLVAMVGRPGTESIIGGLVELFDEDEDESALLNLLKHGHAEALESEVLLKHLYDEFETDLREYGDQDAARHWSRGDETGAQWVRAEFGDATAVNGDLVGDDQQYQDTGPPDGYVRSRRGGEIPTTEQYVWTESVAEAMCDRLKLPQKIQADVAQAMVKHFGKEATWSTSGDSETWEPAEGEDDE